MLRKLLSDIKDSITQVGTDLRNEISANNAKIKTEILDDVKLIMSTRRHQSFATPAKASCLLPINDLSPPPSTPCGSTLSSPMTKEDNIVWNIQKMSVVKITEKLSVSGSKLPEEYEQTHLEELRKKVENEIANGNVSRDKNRIQNYTNLQWCIRWSRSTSRKMSCRWWEHYDL
jgi:hypothetical protein